MSITITLKSGLSPRAEQWLAKNVGPRLHYLHNSIGGEGWIMKLTNVSPDGLAYERQWLLTLEDERFASWFLLQFPQ